ncbi:hypothetical protein [Kistimonas asteriae]|uniref:hypothetical protein n=1 Tax=Kistimonas asteriae TaxID=517724 RepID=UPI001BA7CDAA|nr:hypothetical protein [Kistimonas asteriae]
MLKATATGVFTITLIVTPSHKIEIPTEKLITVQGLYNGYEFVVEKKQDNLEYLIISAK